MFGNEYDGWNLYLVNAVRYQCSLSAARRVLKEVKDYKTDDLGVEIVCECLSGCSNVFRDCLKTRVQRLVEKFPSQMVLVNASTKKGCGKYYSTISQILNDCVNSKVKDVVATTHPFSWQWDKNRTRNSLLIESEQ